MYSWTRYSCLKCPVLWTQGCMSWPQSSNCSRYERVRQVNIRFEVQHGRGRWAEPIEEGADVGLSRDGLVEENPQGAMWDLKSSWGTWKQAASQAAQGIVKAGRRDLSLARLVCRVRREERSLPLITDQLFKACDLFGAVPSCSLDGSPTRESRADLTSLASVVEWCCKNFILRVVG